MTRTRSSWGAETADAAVRTCCDERARYVPFWSSPLALPETER
jgi:hypothetical protein